MQKRNNKESHYINGQKKIARGDSLEKIADDLIEDETVIKPIYQLVQGNPNKTEDDIYQMLNLL